MSTLGLLVSACVFVVARCAITQPVVQARVRPGNAAVQTASPDLLRADPRSWVSDAADNEIQSIRHENSHLRYLVDTTDDRGQRLRAIVESKDGTVARLLRKDGRPLTPEEDAAERERLESLLNSPAAYGKHVKEDGEGKKLAVDLIRLLPDAMTFSYAPGQPQVGGTPGTQIVIDYAPKPDWHPPTTVSAGLKGLRGRAWIDARSRHVVRMEGEIFQGVNFGWGMLAHIYPGGHLYMEQRSVQPARSAVPERWSLTRFRDDLRIRAMMVKTITVRSDVTVSQFQELPAPVSYQQAIQMLLDTPLPN